MSLRQAVLIATWLAGTLLATGTVYAAVSAVAGQVTGQGPAPISQTGIEQALHQAQQHETSPTPATAPTPSPPSTPSQTTPSPTVGGGVSHPTNPPSSPPAANRTFALVGGTTNLSCAGGQITLNWATPNPGFEVETGSSDGGSVIEVRFKSDSHESQLQAWCSGTQIQSHVDEQSS